MLPANEPRAFNFYLAGILIGKDFYFRCWELLPLQFFSCSLSSLDELNDLPHSLHLCWFDWSAMPSTSNWSYCCNIIPVWETLRKTAIRPLPYTLSISSC